MPDLASKGENTFHAIFVLQNSARLYLSPLAVQKSPSDTRPLPEDQGALRLYQLLTKLHTTARMMHTVAHPDDEDGGMMTLEARGNGVTIELFTVTRGEGGQNKFGAESSDDLGILRTLELLQAGNIVGISRIL